MKTLKRIFKAVIKRIELRFANLSDERKRNYLIKQGAHIGEKTRFNCHVDAFGTEPYLVSVGENCLIAADVHFVTHDGGIKVLNALNKFGRRMDKIAPIKVGSNVYIGMGAYIMPGVEIGDNAVIGAGAIVTHSIPGNSVAVGIPAKVIKTIDEYYKAASSDENIYPSAGMTPRQKRAFYENIDLREKYFER